MLLFRAPTTTEHESKDFYQRKYKQGFTTELPFPDQLRQLKNANFKDTEKDYMHYISVLKAIGIRMGARVLDYGCSWGYGSWQLAKAGFLMQAYEISRSRCKFAKENLHVDASWNINDLKGPFDIFFTAHVLEHVHSVKNIINLAKSLLTPGGFFVAFTPNGSEGYRKTYPVLWQRSWGLVHPNLLDIEYWRRSFKDKAFFVSSNPYDCEAIIEWVSQSRQHQEQHVGNLTGNELLCIAQIFQAPAGKANELISCR